MKNDEALEFVEKEFIPLIKDKFIEEWPDTFTTCYACTKEEYEKANPAMYSYYIKFLNNLMSLECPSKYKLDREKNGDYSFIKKLFFDCKGTQNFPKWCIETFKI